MFDIAKYYVGKITRRVKNYLVRYRQMLLAPRSYGVRFRSYDASQFIRSVEFAGTSLAALAILAWILKNIAITFIDSVEADKYPNFGLGASVLLAGHVVLMSLFLFVSLKLQGISVSLPLIVTFVLDAFAFFMLSCLILYVLFGLVIGFLQLAMVDVLSSHVEIIGYPFVLFVIFGSLLLIPPLWISGYLNWRYWRSFLSYFVSFFLYCASFVALVFTEPGQLLMDIIMVL